MCLSIVSVGSLWIVVTMREELFHVVLPCSNLTFVPKMSSACRMSALVKGQFGIMVR